MTEEKVCLDKLMSHDLIFLSFSEKASLWFQLCDEKLQKC